MRLGKVAALDMARYAAAAWQRHLAALTVVGVERFGMVGIYDRFAERLAEPVERGLIGRQRLDILFQIEVEMRRESLVCLRVLRVGRCWCLGQYGGYVIGQRL